MKIIEGMKRIKANKAKIQDLQEKISKISANLSYETPLYGVDTAQKLSEWAQSCNDCAQENVRLLVAIARTNLVTKATVKIAEQSITKTLAEWIWRRREYAKVDLETWSKMTDRGLREGSANSSTGVPIVATIVRHYDVEKRDKKMAEYQSEPHEIDAALEVVNAVTDLIEA